MVFVLPQAARPGGKGSLERPRRSVRATSRLTEGNLAAQWAERRASVSDTSALSEGRCLRSVSRDVFLSESEAMSQGVLLHLRLDVKRGSCEHPASRARVCVFFFPFSFKRVQGDFSFSPSFSDSMDAASLLTARVSSVIVVSAPPGGKSALHAAHSRNRELHPRRAQASAVFSNATTMRW